MTLYLHTIDYNKGHIPDLLGSVFKDEKGNTEPVENCIIIDEIKEFSIVIGNSGYVLTEEKMLIILGQKPKSLYPEMTLINRLITFLKKQ